MTEVTMDEIDYNDPNQPTVTEELLLIIEEFAEYIDKFMFEIVTFLAVIDSSMGLIKDVLSMFGFSGWKMTFFPTFSFIVTIGVFLFGTKKRKGKRKAEAEELEGLGQALEMFDDVIEAVDDVLEEVEKVECEAGGLGLGDYSDTDEDDNDDENPEKTDIKEGETTDVVLDIEVVPGEQTQEHPQQDTEPEPPPKSSIAKAVGMIILVAGIAAKLAGKKKQETECQSENQESGGMENCGNESQNSHACHVTGDQLPPTDAKSKLNGDTCTSSTSNEDTLTEIANDFKQDTVELANAVKDDAIKATAVVKEGTVGAGSLVHENTKQVLETSGALKVGHGLFREVDFISGHLKKEGVAAGKSLENETFGVASQIKENKVVKETGVDRLGTGVYREAAFISGYIGKETENVIRTEEKKVLGLLGQTPSSEGGSQVQSNQAITKRERSSSHKVQGKGHNLQTKGATSNQKKTQTNITPLTDKSQQQTHSKYDKRVAPCKGPDVGKQGQDKKQIQPSGTTRGSVNENTNPTLAPTGAVKVGHSLYREADFISGLVVKEGTSRGKSIEKETLAAVNGFRDNQLVKETRAEEFTTGAYQEAAFVGGGLGGQAKKVIENEEQKLDRLFPPGPSGIVLERTEQDTIANNQLQEKILEQSGTVVLEDKSVNRNPEDIEHKPENPSITANVMEGAVGAAGSMASEAGNIDKKAKQGLQQTQKKSKGLLPIIMRLIRLIMRVANKGKGSAGNSQASSRRASTSDSQGEPAKGKRTADGGGDAANMAGAAASMAMGAAGGAGGGKGGKIGAIVGIVVRLVRLASKLKGGQAADPPSEKSSARLSVDEQSDDEFFDCGEEFQTTEIETQTDAFLLSVSTQTQNLDRKAAIMDDLEVDDIKDAVNEESLSKELKSIALELQSVACENASASLGGLVDRIRAVGNDNRPLLDETTEKVRLEDEFDSTTHQYKSSREPNNTDNYREKATQRIALDPSNSITLQILPFTQTGGARTEASSPILIDIGGPVHVRTTAAEPGTEFERLAVDDQTVTRRQQCSNTNQSMINRQGRNDAFSAQTSSSAASNNEQVTVEIHSPRSTTPESHQTPYSSHSTSSHPENEQAYMSYSSIPTRTTMENEQTSYRSHSPVPRHSTRVNEQTSYRSHSPVSRHDTQVNERTSYRSNSPVPRHDTQVNEQTSYRSYTTLSRGSTPENRSYSPIPLDQHRGPTTGSSRNSYDLHPHDRKHAEKSTHEEFHSRDRVHVTLNPIVSYDSSLDDLSNDATEAHRHSSENIKQTVINRRPSVVRFEDECTSEEIQRRRTGLKPALKQTVTMNTYQRLQLEHDSLATTSIQRDPTPGVTNEWSVKRDSGNQSQSTRLTPLETTTQLSIHSDLTEQAGRRMSYSADDESESRESLC